jgi:transposase-like protein
MTVPNDVFEGIIADYQSGKRITDIARDTGIHQHTIRRKLQDIGVFVERETRSERKNALANEIPRPESNEVRPVQTHVVTSALNNCHAHSGFLQSLLTFGQANSAQLHVIPVSYKNVSLFTGQYEPWWPQELQPYYLSQDHTLNSNISLMGSLSIQATARRPLEGIEGIGKGKSIVVGHPRIAMNTLATPLNKLPIAQFTTGSISLPEYSHTKAGRLGEFHHQIAALVIETDGEFFWWRYIHANENGSFTDLGTVYGPELSWQADPAEAVIVGDVHVGMHDPAVTDAVLGRMVPRLKSQNVVLHDVLDFFAENYHDANDRVRQVLKEARGLNSVYDELSSVAEFLEHYRQEGVTYHIVQSNHHNHLQKWLNGNPQNVNTKNLWLWHHLNAVQLNEAMQLADVDPLGEQWHVRSPFEIAMRAMHVSDWVNFSNPNEELLFKGIDCSQHGHQGPNGIKGTARAFARTQRRTFIGHAHSPGIVDGCYQVGKSCRDDLPYMQGYSSHLSVSGIIYADGHRTLFPIINGKAYLNDV